MTLRPSLSVALDATPLAGNPTGIGRFCGSLIEALARRKDVEVTAWPITVRGRDAVKAAVPPNVRVVGRPTPARALRKLWMTKDQPTAEAFCGKQDVVHGTNFVVPPTRHAARVVSVHDLTFLRFPELCTPDTLQYPQLLRRAIADGAFVHTDTEAVRLEVLEAFDIDADRVMAAHLGIPPVLAGDPAAGWKYVGADRYVLALGTIEPRKGFPVLIDAIEFLVDTHPDVKLVIAGPDGWGVEALEHALSQAVRPDRIMRTGWVDETTRADLLAGATVLAYPSVYEGFGFPPLEAMRVNVPVVASSVAAVAEVVEDAAMLVPPNDPVAWATALERVLDDHKEADRLRAAGRLRCRSFSWDTLAEQMVDFYRLAADTWPTR